MGSGKTSVGKRHKQAEGCEQSGAGVSIREDSTCVCLKWEGTRPYP